MTEQIIQRIPSVALSQDLLTFDRVLETGCQQQIKRIQCSSCNFKVTEGNF